MNENMKTSELMEETLRQKIEEFAAVDIVDSQAKDAAEDLSKATDSFTKLEQQKTSKKDLIIKILTPVGTFLGVIGAAIIKAVCDKNIAERQIDYCSYEHGRAYEWEESGKTEHIVTSPAAKDALRERPKGK